MINIMLSGANGKMGGVIAGLVALSDDSQICAGVDINTKSGDGYEVYENPYEYKGLPDAVIDFSHPDALYNILDYALDKKLPIVIATTGLSKEQIERIEKASKTIPVFRSANMSVGVNVLIDLVKRAAKTLGATYDIEIIEKHHNRKIDAPSGTALMIADKIGETLDNAPDYVYDRHSRRKKRTQNEIGIHAVRGGNIVGEHEVLFAGGDEIIEIKHTAMSREIFAQGAVRAAEFIVGKKPGIYDMSDLINSD